MGYAPWAFYVEHVRVIELSCASVCLTYAVRFSCEIRYGKLFNAEVHMQRRRVGPRGTATGFRLPRAELLHHLLATGCDEHVDFPRAGKELLDVVQLLLKTGDVNAGANLTHIVHQAGVCQMVVPELMLDAKAREHRW